MPRSSSSPADSIEISFGSERIDIDTTSYDASMGQLMAQAYAGEDPVDSSASLRSVACRVIIRAMRLLVIEDDPAVRHMIDRTLTGLGHHVLTAPSAVAMTAALLDFPDTPDGALLDLALPGIAGFAYADYLERHFPGIWIVFMTGFLHPRHVEEARKRGGILPKPFRAPQLLSIIGLDDHGVSPLKPS